MCFANNHCGHERELQGSLEYVVHDGFLPAHEKAPPIALGATVRCVVTFVREDRLALEYADKSVGWAMGWLLEAAQIQRCYVRSAIRKRRSAVMRVDSSDDDNVDKPGDKDSNDQSEVFNEILQQAREEAGMESTMNQGGKQRLLKRKRSPSVEV
uniref:Uncharacterized protein n=1 Tax=Mycena chlorophos TaxID=658473 RepID=A0ABQ0LFL4_MYCCL|nr:predicted protein [Mycena chlorophos]